MGKARNGFSELLPEFQLVGSFVRVADYVLAASPVQMILVYPFLFVMAVHLETTSENARSFDMFQTFLPPRFSSCERSFVGELLLSMNINTGLAGLRELTEFSKFRKGKCRYFDM